MLEESEAAESSKLRATENSIANREILRCMHKFPPGVHVL